MKKLLPYLAIIGLFIFIFNRECTRPGKDGPPETVTVTKTVIVPGDSVPYPVVIPTKTPVYVYKDTGSTQWRNLPVDTMAILADYFTKYGYDDTLMNDTSALIRLQSHTFMNKLFYDQLWFQNRREKQINTTTIMPQANERTKIYLGMGVNFLPGSPGLSGNVLLVTPEKLAMAGGYDFTNRIWSADLYYKIQFKRKK